MGVTTCPESGLSGGERYYERGVVVMREMKRVLVESMQVRSRLLLLELFVSAKGMV